MRLCLDCRKKISRKAKRCRSCRTRITNKERGPFSEETRAKLREARKRRVTREETRIKMSISHRGIKHSEKTKRKLSSQKIGHLVSKEAREKISLAQKNIPEEVRMKRAETYKGAKCHFWLGGISFEPYSPEFNQELKYLIRRRDNFTCQIESCGQKENGKKLSVHHIDYDKKNSCPENLISLCKNCHIRTNYKREYWTKYFQETLGGKP